MSRKKDYIEELKLSVDEGVLPEEIAQIQIAYVDKFGYKARVDLYDMEAYRTGFKGRENKLFRGQYIAFVRGNIENDKRITYDDWNLFRGYPINNIGDVTRYALT
tara:strand:+ start:1989 stop:2303 length:315 start_codon:yes stop_codon:yes gene_type:complete